ncbi:endo-1,3-alpha-glucanase family glycosylhydrolase [Burkholderia sp. DN3021]|uniref:endo-1,3-alpha-glucanase family glycosylhydrolase n=1 Tax=Burkholderia sp. DN3021 TaxID=3410137 RepID=UPI003C7E67B9
MPHLFPAAGEHEIDARTAAEIVERIGAADGYFYFGAAGTPALLSGSVRALAPALRDAGKTFMASVTPYYRGQPQGTNYRAFETGGFAGMAEEWRAAIESKANWVQIVTWNDWAESTYVAPTGSGRQACVYDARFGPILSHEGYLRASRYYIEWFKTGRQPPIVRDGLGFFYRLHPVAMASGAPRVPQGRLVDRIFVCVFLTRPATLTIGLGTRFVSRSLPAGVSFVDVPGMPGRPSFTVVRDTHVVLKCVGELALTERDFSSRYGYYSGWVENGRS